MRILVREQPKKRNNNKTDPLQPTGFAWILYKLLLESVTVRRREGGDVVEGSQQ